jgi:preprotein translocase subunit SecG
MHTFIIVIHILTCAFLVMTVLLQKGKGAEIGAVFGSSDAIFGSAGPASFLSKITTGLAVVFMLSSLTLTYLSGRETTGSVMEGVVTTSPGTPPVPSSDVPEAEIPTQAAPATEETPAKVTPPSQEAPQAESQPTDVTQPAQDPQ